MTKYIALLRGINVSGKNIIKMSDLREAFEHHGFQNVLTYINSGNILFDSGSDEAAIKSICEKIIKDNFKLDVPVCVISATDLSKALSHAPDWWNKDSNAWHHTLFVIPPMTVEEIFNRVGETKEEYEKADYYGRVIFWSAPMATYSKTCWSKMLAGQDSITVRRANTVLKLMALTGGVL